MAAQVDVNVPPCNGLPERPYLKAVVELGTGSALPGRAWTCATTTPMTALIQESKIAGSPEG
jgi:hypothetical protein